MLAVFTKAQRKLLAKYWSFYESLDQGTRRPASFAQKRFVDVCRGKVREATEHEKAYLLGRRLVASGRITPTEFRQWHSQFSVAECSVADKRNIAIKPGIPSKKGKKVTLQVAKRATNEFKEHAVDVSRYSSTRRWVHRYNW